MIPKKPKTDLNAPGYQRMCNLLAIFPISRATIYRQIADGTFPRPDTYAGKVGLWANATVLKHIQNMCVGSGLDDPSIKQADGCSVDNS